MLTPTEVLDHYFLEARCMLVEIAATLDRYDRAVSSDDSEPEDGRLEALYQSLTLLAKKTESPDRARQLLKLFSDPD